MQKDGLPEDVAKDAEAEVQKITDSFMKKIDEMFEKKEKDIMTV
jgi:ribosome recycling factor